MRFVQNQCIIAMLVFALLLFTTNVYANSVDATAHQPGGTITPSGVKLKPAPGVSDLTVAITPSDGYQLAAIILDEGKKNQETDVLQDCVNGTLVYDDDVCSFDGSNVSYTFVNLADDASHTIDVYFVLNPVASFELDSTSPPSGTSEPSVNVMFVDTSVNNPTAWLWDFGDGTTSNKQNPQHTFSSYGTFPVSLTVYNDLNQSADTALMDYIVIQPTIDYTASAGPNGSISPSGNVTVDEGSSTTFSITPNTQYQVADVLVDGVSIGAVSSVTFDVTDKADHTISASFEPIQASTVMLENPPKQYSTLQVAYDAAVIDEGLSEATLRIHGGEALPQNLVFNLDLIATLLGGYDDTFENLDPANPYTIIDGTITIRAGTVTVSNLIIGQSQI